MYSFEHKCLNNIKNIYQHTGKCDYQQNLKYILGAAVDSTREEVTDAGTSLRKTPTTFKNKC